MNEQNPRRFDSYYARRMCGPLRISFVGALLFLFSIASARDNTPFYSDKTHLLIYKDRHGHDRPIQKPAGWRRRRAHILRNFQLVAGVLPDASRKVPLDLQVHEVIEEREFVRERISFATEKSERVPAYLFLPGGIRRKVPAILCLHQTTSIGKGEPAGIGGSGHLDYARELAERGYVTLAPDYPNFGDYHIDPYSLGYSSATMKGIWNHMRAIDVLQSQPQVDGMRIGCIGHSLGGHNAIFVSLFDRRIKAVVSSCGFNSFPKYYGGDLAGWSHKGYMPRIASAYGKDPKRMPFDFTELVAAIAPHPFFINAPLHDANFEVSGVDDCVRAALPVYTLLHATERLVVVHPDCEHDFPDDVREEAYRFLDKWLGVFRKKEPRRGGISTQSRKDSKAQGTDGEYAS